MSDAEKRQLIELLMHLPERLTFPAGAIVFAQNAAVPLGFVVCSGTVVVALRHAELYAPVTIGRFGPGEIVALSALTLPAHPFEVRAETPVEGVFLSDQSVGILSSSEPAFAQVLLRQLILQASAQLAVFQDAYVARTLAQARHPGDAELIARGKGAQALMAGWDEPAVDGLIQDMCHAVSERAHHYAESEVQLSGMGSVPDKVHKLSIVTHLVARQLASVRAMGRLTTPCAPGVHEYGAPVGLIFAVVPATNPVPNALYKMLLALRTRNAVVFSFPRALSALGAELLDQVGQVLEAAQAPRHLFQHTGPQSGRLRVQNLMKNPGFDLVLATGGQALVHAAYSSGNPAFGVGPGNVPALICADANLDRAAEQIIRSKRYDHGIICGSENNLVIDAAVVSPFVTAFERNGGRLITPSEKQRAVAAWFDPQTKKLRRELLGRPAVHLLEVAGLRAEEGVAVILVPAEEGDASTLGNEKMAPILSLFTTPDVRTGIALCARLLTLDGAGHTAVVHTESASYIDEFARRVPAGRILVNTEATFGMMGVSTNLPTAFMLGSGSYGKNITTDAISWRHLINIKRVATHQYDASDLTREHES